MQVSRSVVVATAAAAFWSPFAAAACARDKLMDPPPFAARADAGSNAAITMHKTKRIKYLRCGSQVNAQGPVRMQRQGADSSSRHQGRVVSADCVFDQAGYERTHRRMNSPARASASRPSVSLAFHIGQA